MQKNLGCLALLLLMLFFPRLANSQMSTTSENIVRSLCSCEVVGGDFDHFGSVTVVDKPRILITLPDLVLGLLDRMGIPAERSSESEIIVSLTAERFYFRSGYFPRHVGEIIGVKIVGARAPGVYSELAEVFLGRSGSTMELLWEFYYAPDDENNQSTLREYELSISLVSNQTSDKFSADLEGFIETAASDELSEVDLTWRRLYDPSIYNFAMNRAVQSELSAAIEEDGLFAAASATLDSQSVIDSAAELGALLESVSVDEAGGITENRDSAIAFGRFLSLAPIGKAKLTASATSSSFRDILLGSGQIASIISRVMTERFLSRPREEQLKRILGMIEVNGVDNGDSLEITFR
ncbi:MAG: hypothetical protein AAFQ58_22435 [Pseudomonadota bacterium]